MRTRATTAVLGVLGVAALGVATNVATSALPDGWQPYLWVAWPLMAVLVLAVVILEVRRQRDSAPDVPTTGAQSRAVLLERMHRYWIQGVLERSFHQQARIELGLETTVDAPHPWQVLAAEPEGEPRPVPPGTAMRTVFKDLDRTMLVLGAPGSGKTTMMLELLRDLLADAAHRPDGENHALVILPVMLNLSSWTQRKEQLTEWIIAEVSERYQVPSRHVRGWLEAGELTLLLDGLDEVAEAHRESCVDAINEFRRDHGTTAIVVGCRSADYEELHGRLKLYGTLRLQPLTPDQVNDFLHRIGPGAADARAALAGDQELRELVVSPLMLSVLTLAFPGDGAHGESIGDGPGDAKTRLFHAFVVAMLQRYPIATLSGHALLSSLVTLAGRLRANSQTIFTIDVIDKYWLPFGERKPLRVASWTCAALGILVLGPTGYALLGGAGLLIGVLAGLCFALPVNERLETWSLQYFQNRWLNRREKLDPWEWVFPFSALVLGFIDSPGTLVVAGIIGLTAAALIGLPSGSAAALGVAVSVTVAVVATAWVSYSYSHTLGQLKARAGETELPSPKLWAALRIAPLVAVVIGLLGAGVAWLPIALVTDLDPGRFALFAGVGGFTYALTCLGFYAAVEQAMIRRVLRDHGLFVLPGLPALEHATRCLFLHRVGGGYLFTHQSLLDFFDDLNGPNKSSRLELLAARSERRS
ncbi:NACHT domain-containing protein [Actinoplanes bogorensis]|uniref:NACHT domain-containing protein n=1 Tax=Paractinoplanes bogorensis TaxID=1610840 RepID=A0ABS5YI63_9ACTN|nr:NACHT domain-containing protein [Actinoplanes bogorensis]MBU2662736.1 NACHT domain-containing protein [Actinoplanes bogorensis]